MAWLRSGRWAVGGEAGDSAREVFINNYVDNAFDVDADSGTSLNDVRYFKMAEDMLNTLKSSRNAQALAEARQALERAGFDVRRVADGPGYTLPLTDEVSEVIQPTKFVVDWSNDSGTYQSGNVDGFQNVWSPGTDPSGRVAKSSSEATITALRIAGEEAERTRLLTNDFTIGGHNDLYDAERHARWVYRMTVELGSGLASAFATAHELEGMVKGQPFIETQMDLANNSLGMNAAINGSGIPDRSTPGLIYIQDGRLVSNGT